MALCSFDSILKLAFLSLQHISSSSCQWRTFSLQTWRLEAGGSGEKRGSGGKEEKEVQKGKKRERDGSQEVKQIQGKREERQKVFKSRRRYRDSTFVLFSSLNDGDDRASEDCGHLEEFLHLEDGEAFTQWSVPQRQAADDIFLADPLSW